VLAAGLILIAEAPCKRSMLAAAVYVAAAFFQFAISGLYHTGNWAPSTHKLLMRCGLLQVAWLCNFFTYLGCCIMV
jgi:predicted membrane channel-forming protein YqfA (hemolysin III family)